MKRIDPTSTLCLILMINWKARNGVCFYFYTVFFRSTKKEGAERVTFKNITEIFTMVVDEGVGGNKVNFNLNINKGGWLAMVCILQFENIIFLFQGKSINIFYS